MNDRTHSNRKRIPRWIDAVIGIDRAAWYLYRGIEIARDELLLAWVDPSLYDELTRRGYARSRHYLPGGNTHSCGLFPWERAAITSPPFPTKGRVLVGAVGGGRELPGLAEMGYQVVAFEPNDVLLAGARQVASELEGVEVVQASYGDLVRAVRDGSGPLAKAIGGPSFDAIILGWGSLTHVVLEQERRALLEAIRKLAPRAPVLASFYLRRDGPRRDSKSERLRTWVRPWLARAGAPHRPGDGVGFVPSGGFVYTFTADEVHALAFACGYRVERLDEWEFPHALLVPLETSGPVKP